MLDQNALHMENPYRHTMSDLFLTPETASDVLPQSVLVPKLALGDGRSFSIHDGSNGRSLKIRVVSRITRVGSLSPEWPHMPFDAFEGVVGIAQIRDEIQADREPLPIWTENQCPPDQTYIFWRNSVKIRNADLRHV
jgi:hypothetical protein